MYLQLHDGPTMASARYPRVPDLNLPQVAKVSNRQILVKAVEEGADLALKKLNQAQSKDTINEDLPTLSLDNLEELEALIDEDEGLGQKGMGAKWWVEAAKFIIKNFKLIVDGIKYFAQTVQLYNINGKIQDYYDLNQYNFRNLNEMTPQQIDNQLKIISGDLLNATAEKKENETVALARLSSVYQSRRAMLPLIDQRTMLLIGGGLLAYYFLKKK